MGATEYRGSFPQAAFDLGSELAAANSIGQVLAMAAGHFGCSGIEHITAVRLSRAWDLRPTDVVCNTRPAAWSEAYLARNMIAVDPVMAELRRSRRAVTWSGSVNGRRLSARARSVMALACDFGMNDGLVVPIFDGFGISGVVSLAGERPDLHPARMSGLAMASVYLFNRLCGFLASDPDEPELTGREIEIMKWLIAGKSDWQIGQILSISQKTVNFHVENVKRKYGVATRIQAVVAAVQAGNMDR